MLRPAEFTPGETVEKKAEPAPRKRVRRKKPKPRPAETPKPVQAPPPSVELPFRPRPVQSFTDGDVETAIWLNEPAHPADPPEWRITQRRIVTTRNGGTHARSFRPEDLDPARWGLYQARRWVRRMQRRASLREYLTR
jgi:hypothetical protein